MAKEETAVTEIEDAYHPLGSKAFLDVVVMHAGNRYRGLLRIDEEVK